VLYWDRIIKNNGLNIIRQKRFEAPQIWNESNRAHSDFGNFLLKLYLDKIKQQINSHVNTCTIKLPLMLSWCIRWMLVFPQFSLWWIWLHHCCQTDWSSSPEGSFQEFFFPTDVIVPCFWFILLYYHICCPLSH
jgi:hypothetical protein